MKISQHCPYFQSGLMGIADVIRTAEGRHIPLCIRYAEPRRSDRCQPLCLCKHLRHIVVGIGIRNIMPCQVDRLVLGYIRVNRLLKLSGYGLCFPVFQSIRLHISDNSVFSSHFHPVVFIFQHCDLVRLRHFLQDWALHSAPVADLRIMSDQRSLDLAPLRCDNSPVRSIIHRIFHVRVCLNERKRDIRCRSFRLQNNIILTLAFTNFCIFAAVRLNCNIPAGQRVQHDFLIRIPVKPLIDLIPHN